jgi:4-amino-4-deoxychorismate lyase
LLPGILREELLETGKAQEAELKPADLAAARRLFVGNSLRGLIRARLVHAG